MSKIISSDAVQKAIEVIQQQARALAEQRGKLVEERNSLEAEVAAIYEAPLLAEEVEALMLAQVDKAAQGYEQSSRFPDLISALFRPRGQRPMHGAASGSYEAFPPMTQGGGPMNLKDLHYVKHRSLMHLLGPKDWPSFLPTEPGAKDDPQHQAAVTPGMLCFFFGDVIKAKLSERFRTYQPKATAPLPSALQQTFSPLTADQRREEIAQREQRIARIDHEVQELDAQMALLPDNERSRREALQRIGYSAD